jgi:hypothetical protein
MSSNVAALVVFVATFAAIVAAFIFVKKKRTQHLAAASQSIGFLFQGDAWIDPSQAPWLQTSLFQGNHEQYRNIMTGSYAGLSASLFDYSWRDGKNNHTQTVAAFSHDLRLPKFQVVPNNPVLRAVMKLTHKGHTIEFDSSPDFSRNCMLVADPEDEGRLRQLFTPALLAFLGNLPRTDMLQIEGEGPVLIVYRSQRILPAADVQPFLEKTSTIARTFLSSCGLKKNAYPENSNQEKSLGCSE